MVMLTPRSDAVKIVQAGMIVKDWKSHRCYICHAKLRHPSFDFQPTEKCDIHGEMTGDSYMRAIAQTLGLDKDDN